MLLPQFKNNFCKFAAEFYFIIIFTSILIVDLDKYFLLPLLLDLVVPLTGDGLKILKVNKVKNPNFDMYSLTKTGNF